MLICVYMNRRHATHGREPREIYTVKMPSKMWRCYKYYPPHDSTQDYIAMILCNKYSFISMSPSMTGHLSHITPPPSYTEVYSTLILHSSTQIDHTLPAKHSCSLFNYTLRLYPHQLTCVSLLYLPAYSTRAYRNSLLTVLGPTVTLCLQC